MSQTLSLQIPSGIVDRLGNLASQTGEERESIAIRAICDFLDYQDWQAKETKQALQEADNGDFADDAEVKAVFGKWSRKIED